MRRTFFFLSGFSFTNIQDSQDSRRSDYCRELTSAHSWQPDSNLEPFVSERKSLTTKLRTLLFITVSKFWWRLKPFDLTIPGWVFVKWSYFLKYSCNYVSKIPFYLYQRKRKMNVTFAQSYFAFINSSWDLFLERSY